MAEILLDFERPIEDVRSKIAELQKLSQSNALDVRAEIKALTSKMETLQHDIYEHLTPWQRIQLARHPERPYTLDFIEQLFTNFQELSGDRNFRDDKAIIGGFAMFRGKPVMVIGTQKGRDTRSNLYRNFGWPNPEGYRKALRLMQLADKAGVPIVTFIDTPGAYPGVSSEERHVGEAIAVNLREMFGLSVPVISIVVGEGGSGGALGLGVANRILVLENAYFSVITPEGCAAILWKDRKFAPKAAEALQLTADRLMELGVADEIVPEPFGGAHRDRVLAAELVGKALAKNLATLRKLSCLRLREQRYDKFRAMGVFDALPAEPAEASRGE